MRRNVTTQKPVRNGKRCSFKTYRCRIVNRKNLKPASVAEHPGRTRRLDSVSGLMLAPSNDLVNEGAGLDRPVHEASPAGSEPGSLPALRRIVRSMWYDSPEPLSIRSQAIGGAVL